ncbi:hypothetical protein GGS20DRAFT_550509 [Poronia punctata]|nr:hypothetical protein GGS20DRAFT_550509 [Poronia punctata]
MGKDNTKSLPGTRKRKVKTGCLTCKARHVKCDEGRPACHRCVSTGRKCDGYGIWGGGGNVSNNAGEPLSVAVSGNDTGSLARDISNHFSALSAQQRSYFSWFKYRTYAKLPLPYTTPFWHTLVLQASTAEPAILHAVLALGSAHQKVTLTHDEHENAKEPYPALDPQQQFMLHEYSRAIRALQPYFSNQDKRSIHVALVTCALFTFFENLLGRYVAANAHLHCGLRLLAELHDPVSQLDDDSITAYGRGYVDDWIIEVFMRLHVQAALLGQGLIRLHSSMLVFPLGPMPKSFQSTQQAGNLLDRVMLDILQLADHCSSNTMAGHPVLPAYILLCKQRLQRELDLWLAAYHSTNLDDHGESAPAEKFYMKMPRAYHTMATIILNTCSWPVCERMFDLFTADFIFLIKQLVGIWVAHITRPIWRIDPRIALESPRSVSHTVGDKGWIPLLYFVAVKCRVHRIRHQARRLLTRTVHKEGTWDSFLTLAVVSEIIRLEEGDFYRSSGADDSFDITVVPTETDISQTPLPDSRRLYNIQVRLPEHPLGVMTLAYDIKEENGKGVLRRERCYNLRTRHWVDDV